LIESEKDYPSTWAAITAIAPKIGCTPETLRAWHQKHLDQQNPIKVQQISDQEKMKQMEREIKELNVPMKFYVKQPLFSPRRSSTAHTNNGGFYP
jgi:transposase